MYPLNGINLKLVCVCVCVFMNKSLPKQREQTNLCNCHATQLIIVCFN